MQHERRSKGFLLPPHGNHSKGMDPGNGAEVSGLEEAARGRRQARPRAAAYKGAHSLTRRAKMKRACVRLAIGVYESFTWKLVVLIALLVAELYLVAWVSGCLS